jgi:hypothetical protein
MISRPSSLWSFEILKNLSSFGRLDARAVKSIQWLRANWIAGRGSKCSIYPDQSPGREPDSGVWFEMNGYHLVSESMRRVKEVSGFG